MQLRPVVGRIGILLLISHRQFQRWKHHILSPLYEALRLVSLCEQKENVPCQENFLLLYLLILRPLIKRYTQTPVMAAATPGGTLAASVGGEDDDEEGEEPSGESDETYAKPKRRRKTSLYEHNLNDLREMAQEDPRMVAMIIRSWMNANE